MSERAERYFRLALILLALSGISVSVYVFFLPYNTIADEEEYLSEVFLSAAAQPSGWGIRHLLYPIVLSPSVALAQTMGVEPPTLALAARLANWTMWWLGLVASYAVARRLCDRETAWVAVILITFNWVWMLSSKRLMMDVPGSVWFLLATYFFVARRDLGVKALFGGLACAAMAAVTKFQLGPLVALYAGVFLLERTVTGRHREAVAGLIFSLVVIAGIGLVDRLTYGTWFSSFVAFFEQVLVPDPALTEKYGSCDDPGYYLRHVGDVFSYVVWPLALVGALIWLFVRRTVETLLLILTVVSYLAIMHMVCHKESRYLIAILPQVCILAAGACLFLLRKTTAALRPSARPAILAAWVLSIGLVVVSLVPRHELRGIFGTTEACADFVYGSVALIPQGSKLFLAVPCGMPTTFLKGFDIEFGDLGFNEYTRQRELDRFARQIEDASAVVVEIGNPLDQILKAHWVSGSYRTYVSPHGRYAMYLREARAVTSRPQR